MKVAVLPYECARVVHGVLEDLQPVGALHERGELGADLVLAGGGDLVVVHLHLDAHLLEREADRRADILQRIDRRHREVAALDRRTVAHVAALELLAGRPGRFLEKIFTEQLPDMSTVPLDGVEDEELGLRAESRRCRRCRST